MYFGVEKHKTAYIFIMHISENIIYLQIHVFARVLYAFDWKENPWLNLSAERKKEAIVAINQF